MTLTKHTSTITLITLFLFITTCTTDNSITGNSDQSLAKPTGVLDSNSPESDDDDLTPVDIYINRLIGWVLTEYVHHELLQCSIDELGEFEDNYARSVNTSKSYDFRDNYLSKTDKGEVYTACYYLLSTYGIKNNLIGKYYKEHYDLLKSSIVIANDLQHGNNNNQVLINNDIAEKLDEMLKVYKNHKNHKDIDPVLDLLKYDLNKYRNKPKSEIAKDFQ